MSNNSIIEHKGSMYYVEFREEYLILSKNSVYKKPDTASSKCKASPYCKALILAVLESWTNEKRGKGQDLGVYMTYPQWIDSMYGMFGRTVIIDSLDELVGEKLISRESHRMYGKDTYVYRLDYKEINKRIRALEDRDPNVTRPQVNASTSKRVPSTNKRVPSTSKRVTRPQVNDDPSISGRNIESTNNHYLETTEKQHSDNDTAHADVSTTAQPSQSDKAPLSETTQDTKEEKSEEISTPTQKKIAPRRPVASGKTKQTKKDVARALLQVTEIAAPQKPDPATHPYNGELFMKLADYYRGTLLPESSQPDSKYMKAVKAATSLVQRKASFEDVDRVFRYLLGLDEVKDEQWIEKGFPTSLWSVENNLTNKLLELQRIGSPKKGQPGKQSYQQMMREELIKTALNFPVGMRHDTPEYQDLQNCMMYLQPNDRAEVTRQRIAKQIQQQKKQVSA